MRKTLSLLALACAMAAPAVASAEDVYNVFGATDPSCEVGQGGEGNIIVGSGVLHATETEYRRVGERKDVGNGFFEAEYDVMGEGIAMDRETLRLRITPETVTIQGGGSEIVGYRCE